MNGDIITAASIPASNMITPNIMTAVAVNNIALANHINSQPKNPTITIAETPNNIAAMNLYGFIILSKLLSKSSKRSYRIIP